MYWGLRPPYLPSPLPAPHIFPFTSQFLMRKQVKSHQRDITHGERVAVRVICFLLCSSVYMGQLCWRGWENWENADVSMRHSWCLWAQMISGIARPSTAQGSNPVYCVMLWVIWPADRPWSCNRWVSLSVLFIFKAPSNLAVCLEATRFTLLLIQNIEEEDLWGMCPVYASCHHHLPLCAAQQSPVGHTRLAPGTPWASCMPQNLISVCCGKYQAAATL